MPTQRQIQETIEKAKKDYRSYKKRPSGPPVVWELFRPSYFKPPSNPELKEIYLATWKLEEKS